MELDRCCNDCLSYYSYNKDKNPQKCRLCGSTDTEDV